MRRHGRGHRSSARVIELLLLIALPIIVHFLYPILTLVPKPYGYLGILVMALGLAIQSQAAKLFRDAGTSFSLEGDEGSASSLVTSGPFRYSRNPIYLGMLLWLLGLAILLGSLSAFVFPILVFVLANFVLIPIEERSMQEKFGEAYLEYKSRVRRWF
jgi:protein-S-isoprenylcysteine O-methyltransferase Ste14